jgi:2-keto-4-pentenoate hydratase/2-oxohepta-3-ene-1,7-dioic acid hydratase in catechol pathway
LALPPAIIAIGRNYAAHAAEMGGQAPEHPVVFMKNPAAVIANGEPIVIPAICREGGEQVDYEGELAVIIGRAARDVRETDALRHVAPAASSCAARASTRSARSRRRSRRPASATPPPWRSPRASTAKSSSRPAPQT